MKTFTNIKSFTYTLFAALLLTAAVAAQTAKSPDGIAVQTTAFTYQGRLTDSTMAASGTFDFQFALFNDIANGTVIGTETVPNVSVTNGIFTVTLDFGFAGFPNEVRYLEIRVKRPSDTNYTTLTPRQQITSTPYAIRSKTATTADTATNAATASNALAVGGTPAANIIKEGDTRLTDSRTPAAGSANYVQNTTTRQTANFNVNGTGTANIFNAVTQYNIGGNRVLSVAGSNNLFAGINAGSVNTTGIYNSFFGFWTGLSNTTGDNNSLFGKYAGLNNTTGGGNSFFGAGAGQFNTTGDENSFVGVGAGNGNTTGSGNSFVGNSAGSNNTTGGDNSFFGSNAGRINTTGGNNTIIGTNANVGADNLTYATAIGSGATVSTSNTVVLGRTSDTVRIPGNLDLTGTFSGNFTVPAANVTGTFSATQIPNLDAAKITSGTFDAARIPNLGASYIQNTTTQQTGNFNIGGTGTANIFNAAAQFNIGGTRVLSIAGNNNLFVGRSAGIANTTGGQNTFVGQSAGFSNTTGIINSFIGANAGYANTTGGGNSFVGVNAGNSNTTGNNNSFFGASAGQSNTSGGNNAFIGTFAGFSNTTGENNLFVGRGAGATNATGGNNTIIGNGADVGAANLKYAAAVGSDAKVNADDTIVIGKTAGNYNGAARPADNVQIPGNLTVNGNVKMGASGNLFTAGGEENLRIMRGHIQVSGGNAFVFSGTGYTVVRNSVGVFTITFTTPFGGDIVLTPTVLNFFNAPQTAILTSISESEVRVNVFAANGAAADPLSLLFIAVGVR